MAVFSLVISEDGYFTLRKNGISLYTNTFEYGSHFVGGIRSGSYYDAGKTLSVKLLLENPNSAGVYNRAEIKIGDILVYDCILSSADIISTEEYLMSKFGIS